MSVTRWRLVRRVVLWAIEGAYILLIVLSILGADINPTVYGSASLLELFWVVVNALGVTYAVRNMVASSRDYRRTLEQQFIDPLEIIVARASRRVDRVILVKQVSYLAVGVLACFTPPPLLHQVATLGQAITVLVFIGGSLLLTFLGYAADEDRADVKDVVLRKQRLVVQQARDAATQRTVKGQ